MANEPDNLVLVQLREIRATLDIRFAKVDERFAKIDERFAQMDRRFDQLRSALTNFTLLPAIPSF